MEGSSYHQALDPFNDAKARLRVNPEKTPAFMPGS
jgi:hypothetical protein